MCANPKLAFYWSGSFTLAEIPKERYDAFVPFADL